MAVPFPSEVIRKTMPRALERTSSSSRSKVGRYINAAIHQLRPLPAETACTYFASFAGLALMQLVFSASLCVVAVSEDAAGLALQGLLKDQLELVETRKDGKIRYSIKPIEDKLSFDKVMHRLCSRHHQLLSPACTSEKTEVVQQRGDKSPASTALAQREQPDVKADASAIWCAGVLCFHSRNSTLDSQEHRHYCGECIRCTPTKKAHTPQLLVPLLSCPAHLQVGLAGPSGAGKTVFSHKVQSFIPGEVCLPGWRMQPDAQAFSRACYGSSRLSLQAVRSFLWITIMMPHD